MKALVSVLALSTMIACTSTTDTMGGTAPTASYTVSNIATGSTITFGGQQAFVEDVATDGSSITIVAFLDGFVAPQAASAASIAPQSNTPSSTAAKLKLINDGTGKYVFKTTSLEIIYDKNASKISWSLKSGATVTSLKEEMTAKGVTTIAVSGGEMKLPDSDGDGTPDFNESAATIGVAVNPITLTDISALNFGDIKVGEGIRIQLPGSEYLSRYNGSTLTKIRDEDGTGTLYMEVTDGHSSERWLSSSKDLDAAFKAKNAFPNSSSTNSSNYRTLLSDTSLGNTSNNWGSRYNRYDGTLLEALYYLKDSAGNYQLLGLVESYRPDGVNETSRHITVMNLDGSFTSPTGAFIYNGTAGVGELGVDLAIGDATMNVDFSTGKGTISAPTLSNLSNTGSFQATLDVNTTTGGFTGDATGTFNGVTGTGQLIGSFNGDATLATGIADLDVGNLTGAVALAR